MLKVLLCEQIQLIIDKIKHERYIYSIRLYQRLLKEPLICMKKGEICTDSNICRTKPSFLHRVRLSNLSHWPYEGFLHGIAFSS